MPEQIADPMFLIYAHGNKISGKQAIRLRRGMMRVLLRTNPQMLSSGEIKNTWLQVVPPFGAATGIKDGAKEYAMLCRFVLKEESISQEFADRLRLLLIDLLLRSNPPLLAVDEVSRTCFIVLRKGNTDGQGVAFLQILRPDAKILVEAGGDILVAVPGSLDQALLNKIGGDANNKPVVRKAYDSDLSGGFLSMFVASDDFVNSNSGEIAKMFGSFFVNTDGLFGYESDGGDDEDEDEDLDDVDAEDAAAGDSGADSPKALVVADEDAAASGNRKKPKISRKELVGMILNRLDGGGATAEECPSSPADDRIVLPDDVESPPIVRLKSFLRSRVIGQERAVTEVSRAFNIALAGLSRPERPLLVEFWAGPTSVGKTEMALSLAKFLEECEREILADAKKSGKPAPFTEKDIALPPIEIVDCGMFSGSLSHGISNLIGSPTGYVGSKEDNRNGPPRPPILNDKRFPSNRIMVLLLDEFEKAVVDSRDNGAEIIGILMKILDKGELFNNWGQRVLFDRTVVIFTSNIGSAKIVEAAENAGIGFKADDRHSESGVRVLNDQVYAGTKKEYEKIFSPEFRNRIHRFIAFRFLSDAEYRLIIQKEFRDIRERAQKEVQVDLELAEETVEWFLPQIHVKEGVRKLRDWMDKEIVEPLSRAHNLKWLKVGKTYRVGTRKFTRPDGATEIKAEFVLIEGTKT